MNYRKVCVQYSDAQHLFQLLVKFLSSPKNWISSLKKIFFEPLVKKYKFWDIQFWHWCPPKNWAHSIPPGPGIIGVNSECLLATVTNIWYYTEVCVFFLMKFTTSLLTSLVGGLFWFSFSPGWLNHWQCDLYHFPRHHLHQADFQKYNWKTCSTGKKDWGQYLKDFCTLGQI